MQKNAIVHDVNSTDSKNRKVILVEPIAFAECAHCHENCTKRIQTLFAVNPKNFEIKNGSLVIISTSKIQEAIQSIISLVFPIVMAIAGFVLSNPIYSFFQSIKKSGASSTACPEGTKSLIVILFFSLASFIVLITSRARKLLIYPEITDVLEQAD
ncbi:MAG: SoxR reducing system RseC family protein [Treponema sp.]|nr:SoxR reducing system RseC family protein [Candidatus Treponema scatequi]